MKAASFQETANFIREKGNSAKADAIVKRIMEIKKVGICML
jgi:hypothetical protein